MRASFTAHEFIVTHHNQHREGIERKRGKLPSSNHMPVPKHLPLLYTLTFAAAPKHRFRKDCVCCTVPRRAAVSTKPSCLGSLFSAFSLVVDVSKTAASANAGGPTRASSLAVGFAAALLTLVSGLSRMPRERSFGDVKEFDTWQGASMLDTATLREGFLIRGCTATRVL